MKVDSLNYSILLNFAWYSLDLEKLNREKVKSSAKLLEFILGIYHCERKAKLSIATLYQNYFNKLKRVIVRPLKQK